MGELEDKGEVEPRSILGYNMRQGPSTTYYDLVVAPSRPLIVLQAGLEATGHHLLDEMFRLVDRIPGSKVVYASYKVTWAKHYNLDLKRNWGPMLTKRLTMLRKKNKSARVFFLEMNSYPSGRPYRAGQRPDLLLIAEAARAAEL